MQIYGWLCFDVITLNSCNINQNMNDFQAENIQTKWLFPDLLFHFILCKLFSFAIDTENYSEDGPAGSLTETDFISPSL